MKVFPSILALSIAIFLSARGVDSLPAAATGSPQTPDHGGVIEMKYDGFSRETVISLRKMSVSCAGMKGNFTESCVSMAVSIHCPGIQMAGSRNS